MVGEVVGVVAVVGGAPVGGAGGVVAVLGSAGEEGGLYENHFLVLPSLMVSCLMEGDRCE